MAWQPWLLDERKFLTRLQQAALRRTARERLSAQPRDRARWVEWFVAELGLETGLRAGEMSKLLCGDLWLEHSSPAVFVRDGKGGKQRIVYAREAFVETAREFLSFKLACGESTELNSPVFLSPQTKRCMTVRGLEKAYNRVRFPAGLVDHNLHHLRHTYASELYEASGHNLKLVQLQLGHARITTTQVYAGVFDNTRNAALERLYMN